MKIILMVLSLAGLLAAGCATHSNTASKPSAGPTLAEVQAMAQAHVADSVIIGQIENSPTRYRLTADQIISLKTAGVSDAVLNALINTASKPQPQPKNTVVVQGPYAYPYFVPPPWPWFWWARGGWGPWHHWR